MTTRRLALLWVLLILCAGFGAAAEEPKPGTPGTTRAARSGSGDAAEPGAGAAAVTGSGTAAMNFDRLTSSVSRSCPVS